MKKFNLHSDYLDSSLSLQAREQKLKNFHSGKTWVLVTTDVLARGLDFPLLKTVINFDFPNSLVDYIHRVGRTGRAGKMGKAITFFSPSDQVMLREVAGMLDDSGVEVPEWILKMRQAGKREIKKILKKGVKRDDIAYDRNSKASKKRFKEFEGFVKKQDYKFKNSKESLSKRAGEEAGIEEVQIPEMGDSGEFVPMTKEQMEMFGIIVGEQSDEEGKVEGKKNEEKVKEKEEKLPKKRKARITLSGSKTESIQSILKSKKENKILKKIKKSKSKIKSTSNK